jgi:hypothetical protein
MRHCVLTSKWVLTRAWQSPHQLPAATHARHKCIPCKSYVQCSLVGALLLYQRALVAAPLRQHDADVVDYAVPVVSARMLQSCMHTHAREGCPGTTRPPVPAAHRTVDLQPRYPAAASCAQGVGRPADQDDTAMLLRLLGKHACLVGVADDGPACWVARQLLVFQACRRPRQLLHPAKQPTATNSRSYASEPTNGWLNTVDAHNTRATRLMN